MDFCFIFSRPTSHETTFKLNQSKLVASSEVLVSGLQQLKTGDVVEVQQLQHLLGLWINLNDVLLQGGDGRNIVVTTLTLLLLQLDGNATNLRVTETAHQMRNVSKGGRGRKGVVIVLVLRLGKLNKN